MATLIRSDGSRVVITGKGPKEHLTFEQIKEAIGGGYVEHVACNPEDAEGHVGYFCDEEGKLKNFPSNAEATAWSTYTMRDDVLCGDILFYKPGEELVD